MKKPENLVIKNIKINSVCSHKHKERQYSTNEITFYYCKDCSNYFFKEKNETNSASKDFTTSKGKKI